jgi:hypothetical protein
MNWSWYTKRMVTPVTKLSRVSIKKTWVCASLCQRTSHPTLETGAEERIRFKVSKSRFLPLGSSSPASPRSEPYPLDKHVKGLRRLGERDETCPVSTERWTRRVHFVREEGGGRLGVGRIRNLPPRRACQRRLPRRGRIAGRMRGHGAHRLAGLIVRFPGQRKAGARVSLVPRRFLRNTRALRFVDRALGGRTISPSHRSACQKNPTSTCGQRSESRRLGRLIGLWVNPLR